MIVKILEYDQTRGTGFYRVLDQKGKQFSFRYTDFANKKMILAGKFAKMHQNKLSEVEVGWFWRLILRLKGASQWL